MVNSTPSLFDDSPILPPAPAHADGTPMDVLHDREYRVRAFRKADDLLLIRGAVRDQKPAGVFIAGDPDPLTIHHMQIDIEVRFPDFEIVAAEVTMSVHPNLECQNIIEHYDKLVGLSIARGFTHRVRELFGGPRGCTHTTALLQAMAPVAIQCAFSMQASESRGGDGGGNGDDDGADGGASSDGTSLMAGGSPEQRRAMWQMNLNTCHVWAEDSDWVTRLEAGEDMATPLWAQERMVSLGVKPDAWQSRMRGG